MNTKQIQPADLIYSLRLSITQMSGMHRNTINSQFYLLLSIFSLGVGMLYIPSGPAQSHVLSSLGIAAATALAALLSNMRAKRLLDEMARTDLQLPPE